MRLSMCMCVLCLLPLFAQDQAESDVSLSLGVGVLVNQEPYRDVDSDTWVIPLVSMRYHRFFMRGVDLGLDLVKGDRATLSLTVRPEFLDLDEGDGSYFAGLHERELTAMAGLNLDVDLGNRFSLEVRGETDIFDRNEGISAGVSVGRLFIHGRTVFRPELGITYTDQDYNNYYYGVLPDEVRVDRPFYEPDSELRYRAAFFLQHNFSERFSGLIQIGGEYLGDEITNSPLIDSDTSLFGVVGFSYKVR